MKQSWKLDLLLYFLILVPLMLVHPAVYGQSPEITRPGGCGTEELHEARMNDPAFEATQKALDKKVREMMLQGVELNQARSSTACVGASTTFRVPVVVHLCHYTTSALGTGANLTDADVINSINLLNDRLRHNSGLTFNNPYSGVDVNIELVLAFRDPSGNPTNGIIRHSDDINAENVYGTDNTQIAFGWPSTDYFNLFVVETICDAGSCPAGNGVGGFAYYPSAHGQNYDGAVFRAGSYWSGLVAHEGGHYFGVRHTFQGGCVNNDCTVDGDGVCDTPPKTSPGYSGGTCVAPSNACNADEADLSINNPFRPVANGGLGDQTDDLENYMDYTAGCWEAFTVGQGDRMHASILAGRASLLTSPALIPFSPNDAGITAINYPVDDICASPFTPEVVLSNTGTANLTSCNIQLELNSTLVQTFAWVGNLAPGATQTVTLNPVATPLGTHLLFAYTSLPNGAVDGYAENDGTCIEFDYNAAFNTYPLFEGFEGGTFPPSNFSLYNPDADYTWERNTAVGGFGASSASMLFDNFNRNEIGTVDELRTNILDFTGQTSILLSFDVAYARYNAGNFDGLEVYYSTDCGATWTQVFSKTGTTLATAPDNTSLFIPSAAQWRTETVSLTAAGLNGAPSVMLAFRNIPGWGNVLYVDNINLNATSPLGVQDFQLEGVAGEGAIELSWSYAADVPTERFEIQKLVGQEYQALGEVQVTGNRNPALAFSDTNPGSGWQTYRVLARDINGGLHLSNQVRVSVQEEPVRVFPNPFVDMTYISGSIDWETSSLMLVDITGKEVFGFQETSSEVAGVRAFDMGKVPAGMYFLRIVSPARQLTFKLIKH